jgi:hypothetical protein
LVWSGRPFNLTVRTTDGMGGPITNYQGTVHFHASTTRATLPADYTFTGADQGSHTFTVTLDYVGTQSIDAVDASDPTSNGSVQTEVGCSSGYFSTGSGRVCPGGVVWFKAGSETAGALFHWTGPAGFVSDQPEIDVTIAGTYVLLVSFPDGCHMSGDFEAQFESGAPLSIETPPVAACSGLPTSASIPDAGSGVTYNWSVPGGTILSGIGTRSITYSAPAGPLTISASVQRLGACVGSGSAAVTVPAAIQATIPDTLLACGPQSIDIPLSLTGSGPWTIYWSDGFVQTATTAQTTRTYEVTGPVMLGILAIEGSGCTSALPAQHTLNIFMTNPPVVTLQPRSTVVVPRAPVTFQIEATGDALHYQWYRRIGDAAPARVGTDDPAYMVPAVVTPFTVWVDVTNGCATVESQHVDALLPASHPRAVRH